MRKDKVRAHCPRCRHQQIFVQARINHPLHLALAMMTMGLWLVSWVALCIGKVLRPWRCEHCGWHKPEFGHHPAFTGKSATPSKAAHPANIARSHAGHPPPLIPAQSSRSPAPP